MKVMGQIYRAAVTTAVWQGSDREGDARAVRLLVEFWQKFPYGINGQMFWSYAFLRGCYLRLRGIWFSGRLLRGMGLCLELFLKATVHEGLDGHALRQVDYT